MSEVLRFDFALQEPAMGIAPVFVALQKTESKYRPKLDVTLTFGKSELRWRGPDALGILEQSVLLGLLSIAGQQKLGLSLSHLSETGKLLLPRISLAKTVPESHLALIKASWKRIATAAGYESTGGKNVKLVKNAVMRLAETTIWEKRAGKEYESRLLGWMVGDNHEVLVVLNQRATDALCGGQYVKVSLNERRQLPDDPSKALHAWLSAHVRPAASRVYGLAPLQKHVWGNESSGSTLRNRLSKLRIAFTRIGQLPTWECSFLSQESVKVARSKTGTIEDKHGDYHRALGTIEDS